jgi:hypothetical protein
LESAALLDQPKPADLSGQPVRERDNRGSPSCDAFRKDEVALTEPLRHFGIERWRAEMKHRKQQESNVRISPAENHDR